MRTFARKLRGANGTTAGRVLSGLATALLAGTCLVATATAASAHSLSGPVRPLAGEFHQIRNVQGNACLQPQTVGFGALIVQRPCNGSTIQGWAALDMGNNHYRFLNSASGWCMFTSDNLVNGTRVWQDECAVAGGTTVSNAEWNSGTKLPDVVSLRSRVHFKDNNFCLDEPGGSQQDGLPVQVWTCNNNLNQRWVVGFD